LVPEPRALVAEHPLREHFHAQLMLALAGTGRRAEALAAYHDARPGLTFSADGTISGTPTTAGDSTLTFLIQDSSEDTVPVEATLVVTVSAG
jgi:transcriptional activator/putative Ig domain-containing protein